MEAVCTKTLRPLLSPIERVLLVVLLVVLRRNQRQRELFVLLQFVLALALLVLLVQVG